MNRKITIAKYLLEKIRERVFRFVNYIIGTKQKKIFFIFGHQRSGTTLLQKIFEFNSNHVSVYPEYSKITYEREDRIRLKDLNQVHEIFKKDKSPVIVAKPIVESQNAKEILEYFPQSKAIWVYRNFKDVVSSCIVKWGSEVGYYHLKHVLNNDFGHWRAEKTPDFRREEIAYFHRNYVTTSQDAMALFWYMRNQLYFDLDLHELDSIKLFKYEELVKSPEYVIKKMYDYIPYDKYDKKVVHLVSDKSIGKGNELQIHGIIKDKCIELMNKLDQCYLNQNYFDQ